MFNLLKRIAALVALLGLTVFALSAQGSAAQAEAMLKEVSTKYKGLNTLQVNFKLQIDIPDEDADQYQTGLVYTQGDKWRLDLGEQMILTDGQTTWTVLKDIPEVQITNFEMDEEMISPSQLFTMYDDKFIYRIKEEAKDHAGNDVTILELTPKEKEVPYFKIDVSVSAAKNITAFKIYERSGLRYTYQTDQQQQNPKLGEDFFVFKKSDFPGIEVVDLR